MTELKTQPTTKSESKLGRNILFFSLIIGPPIIIVVLYSYMMTMVAETDGIAPVPKATVTISSPQKPD